MGKKTYRPDEIDHAILPLVDLLNKIDSIETYLSCEGHTGEQVFSRTPYVCFWLSSRQTESGDYVFPYAVLAQAGTLCAIVANTFEDGYHEFLD